ncbi:MAG: GDP-L-fucose synthase [Bdellovibrionaceae bacterium]|nr:GDP-L-fucose synthase [Bdellovibrionales bacterium]MCB9254424.1 GDP-L-fucose synthase [Pseudobdellovibrionaceae bacterium]
MQQLPKDTPIFVAGHKGLIGSAFVRRFAKEGFTNVLTEPREALDLTDQSAVLKYFQLKRPKVVLLCAARVGGIVENRDHPAEFITENLGIQLSVMKAAYESGVEKLLFFGSSCMYPRECLQPMEEASLFSGRPEDTSLPYAVAKLAGLITCLSYNTQYGGNRFMVAIPNNAYGPNDDFDPKSSHVLSALIRKFHDAKTAQSDRVTLWGTGTPRREFVHADDIVDASLFLLREAPRELQYPINIGVGEDYSIRELASLVADVVGFKGTIEFDASHPDGSPRKLLDSSRLEKLGWKANIELKAGIQDTYKWFLNDREAL